MKILDFHTHLDDRWFQTPLLTPREYVAGLDRCGVEKACVFTLMGFYEDARRANDLLLKRSAIAPGRLLPFVTVDPKLGTPAIDELERCLATRKFYGLKFHPWVQAFAPSMVKPTMIELLKRAAAAKIPVLFHDGTPPYSTTFQIAQCARWVPQATIILGHAGLADYTLAAGKLLREIPNLYGCLCGPRTGDFRYLVQMAGPEKLVFGSDYGLSDWLIIPDRLDSVLHAGLADEQVRMILWDNAAKLLRLT